MSRRLFKTFSLQTFAYSKTIYICTMADQQMIRVITPEGRETIVPAANELQIREMYAHWPPHEQIKLRIERYHAPEQQQVVTSPGAEKAKEFNDELQKILEARRNKQQEPKRKYTKKQTA